MTIIRHNSLNNSVNSSDQLARKQFEEQRMRDVRLLLLNLSENEEATIKLVLDCLYDIGAVNFINQKFRYRPFNRVMKSIAGMSKPIFRIYAWHWFRKNCPQLIANWLYTQVAFENPINVPQEIEVEASAIQQPQMLAAKNAIREIKALRHQIRWLTGIIIISLSTLGIVITTFNRNPPTLLQRSSRIESTINR
ncbi:hypothetical protein [Anabaena azotica]|uniref:Uncharacterized protein n=1 Tax=Anabaena azotica FACHB-119 TaxID=947527 RepID=A0ABR8D2C2_9NOST|nr:hypothetical protein [Anabaena azotica]MBD2501339.1 hypothetical protein [Anabaena azotica FACHB-119]